MTQTIASARSASRFRTVSSSVSPLVTLDVCGLTLTTSAPSLLPATSNDVRVRVEASKNRLTTVRPSKTRAFFTSSREHARPLFGSVQDYKCFRARAVQSPASGVGSTSSGRSCRLIEKTLVFGRIALFQRVFEPARERPVAAELPAGAGLFRRQSRPRSSTCRSCGAAPRGAAVAMRGASRTGPPKSSLVPGPLQRGP